MYRYFTPLFSSVCGRYMLILIIFIHKRDWIERAYTSTQNQVCLCSLYAILLGDDFDTVDIFFFSGPI